MKCSIATLSTFVALALAAPNKGHENQPQCTDGGQLHCCQFTQSGSLAPVIAASDELCYDITPAVINCIISDAPIDPDRGCVGEYACCQVNDLAPVLGMFCSKPPGDCTGDESGQPPYCLDVVNGRFGNCSDKDVDEARNRLGLGNLLGNGGALGTGLFKDKSTPDHPAPVMLSGLVH